MPLNIKKARDIVGNPEESTFSVTVYGDSGTGKTTCGAMLERPLILLTEPNGLRSVYAANPEADVVVIKTYDELLDSYNSIRLMIADSIKNGTAFPYKWVVLDSLTDMSVLMKDHVVSESGKGGSRVIKSSAKGTAKDVDKSVSVQQWGIVKDRVLGLVRSFRDLPHVNKLFLCLQELISDEVGDDSQKNLRIPMMIPRSTSDRLVSMCNIVGMAYRTTRNGESRHAIRFGGSGMYRVKKDPNVANVELPRLDDIIERMRGSVDPAVFSASYAGINGVPYADDADEDVEDGAVEVIEQKKQTNTKKRK